MPNVAAVYPSQVINYGSDVINFTTTVLAEHINYLRAEVTAVEDTLGTYVTTSSGWTGTFSRPSISTVWNTLKDRVNNIEYGLNVAYNAKTPSGGTSGQILAKNSSTDYDFSWTTANFLPSQSTNNGKFLTTNGTSASWSSISQVPSVTSQSGKYLYTDGSTYSWNTVPAVYSAPTLGSTSISSGATVTNVNGLTINSTTIPTSKTLVATDSTAYVIPSQTGNTGKYLYTDGSTSSWQSVANSGANEFVLMMMGA